MSLLQQRPSTSQIFSPRPPAQRCNLDATWQITQSLMMPSDHGRREFPPSPAFFRKPIPPSLIYSLLRTPYAAIRRSCGAGVFPRPYPFPQYVSLTRLPYFLAFRLPNARTQRGPKLRPRNRGADDLKPHDSQDSRARESRPTISISPISSLAFYSFISPPRIPTLQPGHHGTPSLNPHGAQVPRAQ